jgi:hypothetical protein
VSVQLNIIAATYLFCSCRHDVTFSSVLAQLILCSVTGSFEHIRLGDQDRTQHLMITNGIIIFDDELHVVGAFKELGERNLYQK